MKYTREQAIEKAIKKNREVNTIVKYIMNWDTERTSIELAREFKKSRIWVYKMATKYGLSYCIERGKKTWDKTLMRRKIVGELRKQGYQLRQIAEIFNCRWQYVQQLCVYDNEDSK